MPERVPSSERSGVSRWKTGGIDIEQQARNESKDNQDGVDMQRLTILFLAFTKGDEYLALAFNSGKPLAREQWPMRLKPSSNLEPGAPLRNGTQA